MNPRVLIFEPDLYARDLLAELVSDGGFEVEAAANVEQAVELLRSRDYQLVLSDHPAPGEDGTRMLAPLLHAAAPSPVVVMTAWNHDPIDPGLLVAALLRKPFDVQELLAVVGEQTGASDPIAPEERAIVEAYFARLSARDWDGLAALCAEDLAYEVPGTDPLYSRKVDGREAFRDFSAETFASLPPCHFSVEAILRIPRGVVARYRSVWAQTAQGGPGEANGAVVFGLENGLIRRIGVRLDLQRLRALVPERAPSNPVDLRL